MSSNGRITSNNNSSNQGTTCASNTPGQNYSSCICNICPLQCLMMTYLMHPDFFGAKKNANRAAPQFSPRRSCEQFHTRQTTGSVIPELPLMLVCEHHKPCSSVQAAQDYLLLEDGARKSVSKSARVKDHMVQPRLTAVKMSPIQRTYSECLLEEPTKISLC